MNSKSKKIAKIEVDRNLCIGIAACIGAAPQVFELNGENKAVLKLKGGKKNSGPAEKNKLEASDIDDETLLPAAQSCPVKAIKLYDEKGSQIYP